MGLTFFLLSYSTTKKTKSCLMFQSKAADKSVRVGKGVGGWVNKVNRHWLLCFGFLGWVGGWMGKWWGWRWVASYPSISHVPALRSKLNRAWS